MYIICSRDHVEASTVRARLVPQVQVVTLVQSEAHADDLLPPEFCELMLEESSEGPALLFEGQLAVSDVGTGAAF